MDKVNNAEFYLVSLAYNPYLVVTFNGVYNSVNFELSDYDTTLDDRDFNNSNTNNYGLVKGDESTSKEVFDLCCDAWEAFFKKKCAQYLITELIKIDEDDLFNVEYAGHFSTFKTVEFIANFAGVDTDNLLNSDCYDLQDEFDDYSEFIDYAVNVNNTIIDEIIEKLENLE
jgi:hypothetical protein